MAAQRVECRDLATIHRTLSQGDRDCRRVGLAVSEPGDLRPASTDCSGVILGAAPTAFLWGCVFGAFWVGVQTRLGDTALASLIAAVLTALFLFIVPQPFRAAGNALYRKTLLPEVTPSSRIAMMGSIRIDLPRPRWDNLNKRGASEERSLACDNLCMALLFTPGVKSVTINRSTRLLEANDLSSAHEFDRGARLTGWFPRPSARMASSFPNFRAAGFFLQHPRSSNHLSTDGT